MVSYQKFISSIYRIRLNNKGIYTKSSIFNLYTPIVAIRLVNGIDHRKSGDKGEDVRIYIQILLKDMKISDNLIGNHNKYGIIF